MDSMYETLMGLPLFAGTSHQKLSEIIGKYRFHFLKFAPGEKIISEGDPCTHLKCIIGGYVGLTISNATKRFKVSQTLEAPDVISPDFFFGKTTHYPATATALTDVGIVQIDKADYMNIITSDPIFLFNYLNLLSMNAQLSVEGVLALTSGSLEKRICYWIIALTQNNGKNITLECRHKDMYTVFGVQRQSLISALDHLRSIGAIEYDNTEIRVTDRKLLMGILTESSN